MAQNLKKRHFFDPISAILKDTAMGAMTVTPLKIDGLMVICPGCERVIYEGDDYDRHLRLCGDCKLDLDDDIAIGAGGE